MIQYISEFGLPKEFSKKKKFELLIGMFIPNDQWKTSELKWDINLDKTRVFLTVNECAKYTIECVLNSHTCDDATKLMDAIQNGYIAIAAFEYTTSALNTIPLARDPQNNIIDCNWNAEMLSFDFTFRDNKWDELTISTLKIDSVEAEVIDNCLRVTKFNVYPVIDATGM